MNSVSQLSPKRALVTGATGAVGPALVALLLERGYLVRVLVRGKNGRFPPTVETIIGDITDPDAVHRAVAGCHLVFHLAAKLHLNPAEASAVEAEYERVNVSGTKNVVEAAEAADVERLIFFSTINVYGTTTQPQIFDESSAPNPETIYAQTKLTAENIALSLCSPTGKPKTVILRLASVYGANMKGNYVQILRWVSKGLFIPVGQGQNRRTLIFDQDLAHAALLAAEHAQAPGQIYNVADGQIHTFQKILEAIYKALNRKKYRFTLPLWPLRTGLLLLEKTATLLGLHSPIAPFMLDKLTEDMAVCSQKIQRELGFIPQYNLLNGWQLTAKALNYL